MQPASYFRMMQPYFLPAAVVAYLVFRTMRLRGIKARLPMMIPNGGVVVDVAWQGERDGLREQALAGEACTLMRASSRGSDA